MINSRPLDPGFVGCFVSLVLCAACTSDVEQHTDPRTDVLVSADWLAAHINDSNLVILHVGDSTDYAAEHIPGAHRITRVQVSQPRSDDPDALVLELPDPNTLEAVLESFGISDDSKVVIYWGSEWVSPATRIVFTLDWAGLGDRTVLLDGGIEAWKRAGGSVTADLPTVSTGTLTVQPRSTLVVDADWVGRHADDHGYALIDARSGEYFSGEREGRVKTGHIPGAGSAHWMSMVSDSLMFLSTSELAEVFATAGVEPSDTVVGYCHIGQYATVALFAARSLGYPVKLYDGSFQDWAARDLTVVADSS